MTSAGATASAPATLDIPAVRAALKADGLDAWLLYDFRGINSIAVDTPAWGSRAGTWPRRWGASFPPSANQAWCMR